MRPLETAHAPKTPGFYFSLPGLTLATPPGPPRDAAGHSRHSPGPEAGLSEVGLGRDPGEMEVASHSRRPRPGKLPAPAQSLGGASDARAAPSSEVAAEGPASIRFCPGCRGDVKPAFHFCPYCGELLPNEADMENQSSLEHHGIMEGGTATAGEGPKKRKTPQSQGSQRKKMKWAVPLSPAPSSPSRSPGKAKGQDHGHTPKSAKTTSPETLGKFMFLTDKDGQHWRLGAQVDRSLFEATASFDTAFPKQRFSIKLDLKNGRLLHEQIFFQRAAKEREVERWKKSRSIPTLAIPTFITFGLHQDIYRFLVFPNLGRSLQSILNSRPKNLLSEKTVFHLLFRLVDALEFIHDNEYVHGNISAESIFVNPDTVGQVILADYSFVFRYCPGGKHVAYLEQKRTPHQGTLEFISLDLHKGIDPSRRSDMQALGYCLLKWLYGTLPWTSQLSDALKVMKQKERFLNNVPELLRQFNDYRKPPEALQVYLNKAMTLRYEEKPNYKRLRTVLMSALKKHHITPYKSINF
ncbi:serine/threonine-protein kinase VRK3 [Macrotis lagotis]|uniref:serine/threonine-protein kinase VRK3 n=1 Tax=Macrotis lagotis TaxID=92651 RepID=UPI003D68EEB8